MGRGKRRACLALVPTPLNWPTAGRPFSLAPSEGERVGVRGLRESLSCLCPMLRQLVTLANPRTTIVRQWMRCSCLERPPDRVPNRLLLPPQMGIPEPQHLHPLGFQPRVALRVGPVLARITVLHSVQLDIHARLGTKEIQNVRPEGVLAPELVGREPPVAQPGPDQFLGPGIVLAQQAG